VDLAAMRDALAALGGDPSKANPLMPADLVIDHSVQVDEYGTKDSFNVNALLEFQRNKERYMLLRWAQTAFRNFRVVPPDTGIVHQVNLEYLAPVVFRAQGADRGMPHVADHQIGAHVGNEPRHIEFLPFVDGPSAHEDFAALIETKPPAKRGAARSSPKRVRLERKNSGRKVWTIANDPEETCHRCSPRPLSPSIESGR